jgi:DNA-binding response OmpR family regulator
VTDGSAPLVLYVEDDPAVMDLGVGALEDGGFGVVGVGSGAEALRELDRTDVTFKALVTDIDLPGEINGWEVARRARERHPELPVIYVSGGGADEWAAQGVPNSVMLEKPFALAQLVVAVSTATLGGQSDHTSNT